MRFKELLVESSKHQNENSSKMQKGADKQIKPDQSTSKSPEQLLRSSGFKIKLVTPTSFGVQVDFAKKYDEADIESVLDGFNIKIKNKSVFIIE